MTVAFDALSALLAALPHDQRAAVATIAERLVALRLPEETQDAILATILVEATNVSHAVKAPPTVPSMLEAAFAPPASKARRGGAN